MKAITTKRRTKAVALTLAAVALAPIAAAVPAHATTTKNWCSVTPVTPYAEGHLDYAGRKLINYDIYVSCAAGRYITIEQEVKEDDSWPSSDDLISKTSHYRSYATVGGSTVIRITQALPNTEWGEEEMYQRVRFNVGWNGFWGGWTNWENSSIRSFAN